MPRINRAIEIKQIQNAVQRSKLEKSVYGGGQISPPRPVADSTAFLTPRDTRRNPTTKPITIMTQKRPHPRSNPCQDVPTLSEVAGRSRDERTIGSEMHLSGFNTSSDRRREIPSVPLTSVWDPVKYTPDPIKLREKMISVSFMDMPEEVHETTVRQLPPAKRSLLMRVNTYLWKRGIFLETFLAERELANSEIAKEKAVAIAEELNETDIILLQSVMQLARDAVRRFPLSEFQAVADSRAPSALVRLAEETICRLAFPAAEPIKTWDKEKSWSLESPAPIQIEWHLTFRKFMEVSRLLHVDMAEKIASLDVVDLGAKHLPIVESLTARFSELVSEEDFAVENMTPATHWATITLLWLRKVHQCCQAAGTSLTSTHAVRELKVKRKQLDFWKKRQREQATHEMKRNIQERDRMFTEMTEDMQHLSQRAAAISYNSIRRDDTQKKRNNRPSASRHIDQTPSPSQSKESLAQAQKEDDIRRLGFTPTTLADRVLRQRNGTQSVEIKSEIPHFIVEPNFMSSIAPG